VKRNKIWPVLRDVIIVTVLTGLGGFIVGFASTEHNSPLYIYSLALSNSLFCIIGLTISGCLAVGNRWRHLAIVAAIVWVVSIFNVIFFRVTIIQWAASAIAVAIFALIGGGISLLFKRKKLVEISSNAGDDKFYEEVARELQDKPMVPGLWTKAFAEMGGDDAKARALYIKYRVAQLAEASRQQRPEEQKHSRNTQVIFVAAIFAVVVLATIFGVMTSNKNFKTNASAVTPTEQPPAVQTPAESNFDRQKKLAEKGNADAQCVMGFYYGMGVGVAQDYAESAKWYRMAADQGNADAEYILGTYCANGFGAEKDEAEAAKWYWKAAEQGNVDAQNKLGDCYAYGWGVETNFAEAYKWYSLAARYYGEKARLHRNK
jgi:flagellar basal body-associated protein FliL